MIAKQNTSSGCSKPCSWKSSEANWTQSPKHHVQQISRPQCLLGKRYKKLNQYFYTEYYSFGFVCYFFFLPKQEVSPLYPYSLSAPLGHFASHEAFWFIWLPPSQSQRFLTTGPTNCSYLSTYRNQYLVWHAVVGAP